MPPVQDDLRGLGSFVPKPQEKKNDLIADPVELEDKGANHAGLRPVAQARKLVPVYPEALWAT
jgi:hypothetical protein